MSQERIITPEATLMWSDLFEPVVNAYSGKEEYKACLVFQPDADISELRDAVEKAARARWGSALDNLVKAGKFQNPLRPGTTKADRGWPEDVTVLDVKTHYKPGVVSLVPDADGNPTAIEDPSRVYPGVVVKASLAPAYAYDNVSKGVSFRLGNVQVLRHGEPLEDVSAVTEFTADPNAVADLADADDDLSDLKVK